MNKDFKLITISFPGNYSLCGYIIKEYGIDVYKNINDYNWVILVPKSAIDMIACEAISLEIKTYIVVDKEGMVVCWDGKPRN